MKKSHLQELIRHITRSVLKEFSTMSSSADNNSFSNSPREDAMSTDKDNTPPSDAMSSSEKSRADREVEHARQQQLKMKQGELDSKKKELEFNKKKLDQQKRFDIPNINKDIQKLKGANLR